MIMNEIIPIVMNDQLQKIAIVEDYISLIWSSRYYASGDFELVVNVNDKYMNLFKQDYFIMREDDENIGVIEDITIQRSEDGKNIMIIKGRFLECLLARRIVATQTTLAGAFSDCIYQLIDTNVINPLMPERQISNFVCAADSFTDAVKAQYTGNNLLEVICELCKTYSIGFKVTLNSSNKFVFSLYQGTDHSYDQSVNPWIVFSDEYDNLLSATYEENYQNIATAVLVAGEGEGAQRRTEWVTDGSTGINRHEVYKDQRQIQSNNGAIKETEYTRLLQEAGKEALTAYTTAFAGVVYFDEDTYRNKVQLGDICVIRNDIWGISINSRLVEVIESVSETGEYSIVPSFGV